jgi:putative glycosyltransferase (TIGR04372 family)
VLTNCVSNALPLYSRHDVFLPKLLKRAGSNVPLTFAEMFSPTPRHASYSGQFLHELKLEVIDNSPDDIRAVVVEMLDRLDGREAISREDEERQAQFAAMLRGNGLDGFPRGGREFLRRYAHLLPERSEEALRAVA